MTVLFKVAQVMLIGAHQPIPIRKHAAVVPDISRMMKVMKGNRGCRRGRKDNKERSFTFSPFLLDQNTNFPCQTYIGKEASGKAQTEAHIHCVHSRFRQYAKLSKASRLQRGGRETGGVQ